tara:strand:- start:2231 stop:2449 length:219 start_codon:yes stop_codon:yes gene_type:complete
LTSRTSIPNTSPSLLKSRIIDSVREIKKFEEKAVDKEANLSTHIQGLVDEVLNTLKDWDKTRTKLMRKKAKT